MRKYKSRFIEVGAAILVLIGVALSVLSNAINLSPFIGYALTVIPILWLLVNSTSKLLWAQPVIDISANVFSQYKDGEICVSAHIIVFNHEELPIANCYATLKQAEIYFRSSFLPSQIPVDNRLRWVEIKDSNSRCEITIPPKDHKTIDVASTLKGFRYNLCDNDEHHPFPNDFMYGTILLRTLKIRIDGEFNGKAMKPLFLEGYIYLEHKNYGSEVTEKENGEVVKSYVTSIPYIDMVFEEGNVMKNKTLAKYLKLDNQGT